MFSIKKIALCGACYLALSFTCVFGQDTEVVLSGDVGFIIGSNEKIEIHGSLIGKDNAIITNNGQVNLHSSNSVEIEVVESEALFSGQGEYALIGDGAHSLYGNGDALNFSYLTVDKSVASADGDVYLYSDLLIEKRFSFLEGIIRTRNGSGSSVYLNDSLPSSLRYILPEDNRNNVAFVDGVFYQKVMFDSTYFLPVGSEDFYTPLKLSNSHSNISQLRAEFNYDVPVAMENTIAQSYLKFNRLMETGLWNIASDVEPIDGSISMDAYFFNFNEYLSVEDNMFAIVHNDEPQVRPKDWRLAGEMPLGGMPSRRYNSLHASASNIKELGDFGIAQADLYKLINLISPGGGRETRVVIPNLDTYDQTELIVYDSFGSKVFSSKPYSNNMDMEGYRDGTYYYIFNYVKNGQRGTIQSYIDVKSKY